MCRKVERILQLSREDRVHQSARRHSRSLEAHKKPSPKFDFPSHPSATSTITKAQRLQRNMDIIKSLFPCLPHTGSLSTPVSTTTPFTNSNQKTFQAEQQKCEMASQTGKEILNIFLTGPNDDTLSNRIKTIISHRRKEADVEISWWRERVAGSVISGLMNLVEEVEAKKTQLSGPMVEAFMKSKSMALEFAKEHPIVTGVGVLIVLGIALYLLGPWILEALGFAAKGPVRGMLFMVME